MANSNHSKGTEELLDALHGELTDALLRKIRNGEATAADLAVARQFLKDNGIDAIPTKSNGLGELAEKLPFKPTEQDLEEESEHL